MFRKKGIKLHVVIGLLIVFIVVSTVSINWLISMSSYKKGLTENHLQSNYNYAKKLMASTKYQLDYMEKNIEAIGVIAGSHDMTQDDLDTWFAANSSQFNSLFTTDEKGIVQFVTPGPSRQNLDSIVTKGMKFESAVIKEALRDKKTFISEPYYGTTGQLLTLISAPIFEKETGEYKGIVGGTIYMESTNVLKSLLATHEYGDPSYVYVVDHTGKLIYHPNTARLGEDVSENEVVQKVMNGESGSEIVTNTEGDEYFTGFSAVDFIGWGIIAQTPTAIVEESISDVFWRMVFLSIPFLIIILVIGGIFVRTITKPIKQLAAFSQETLVGKNVEDVDVIQISSPIYEVRQLYYQGIDHLRVLNKQANMDGLTEIANRRTFDSVITKWIEEKIPFSLIMLDIDFFKKINDTHGHLVGDEVLKFLAREMVSISGEKDLCYRYGGEEFGILVKSKGKEETFKMAEDLRTHIANTMSPSGESIEISLGVTSLEEGDQHAKQILNRADIALYQSKRTGRNKTTINNDGVLKEVL